MRYGIFSNVFAHLGLLSKVLYFQKLKADKIICLGNIVCFGNQPNECIELLQERNIKVLQGVYDHLCANEIKIPARNSTYSEYILNTRKVLTPGNKAYLDSLPKNYLDSDIFAAYYFPLTLVKERNILPYKEILEQFRLYPQRLFFLGHTYSFLAIRFTPLLKIPRLIKNRDFQIKRFNRYLIDVGNTYIPGEDNQISHSLIFDTNEMKVSRYSITHRASGNDGLDSTGVTAPLLPRSPIQIGEKHIWPEEDGGFSDSLRLKERY